MCQQWKSGIVKSLWFLLLPLPQRIIRCLYRTRNSRQLVEVILSTNHLIWFSWFASRFLLSSFYKFHNNIQLFQKHFIINIKSNVLWFVCPIPFLLRMEIMMYIMRINHLYFLPKRVLLSQFSRSSLSQVSYPLNLNMFLNLYWVWPYF